MNCHKPYIYVKINDIHFHQITYFTGVDYTKFIVDSPEPTVSTVVHFCALKSIVCISTTASCC